MKYYRVTFQGASQENTCLSWRPLFYFSFSVEIFQCSAFQGKSGLCVYPVLSSRSAGTADLSNAASQMSSSSRKYVL